MCILNARLAFVPACGRRKVTFFTSCTSRAAQTEFLFPYRRQRIEDVPALYFVSPTDANVQKIAEDLAAGLYDSAHLNFSSSLPR